MSIDPGPSSSSQLATFPTSRCHSPSPKRLDAQVSGGISPGQWVSPTWVSKQQMEEIQSEYVSVCESLAQRDVLVDPVLLLDAEIDSKSKQAAIPRVPTRTSSATGGVFSCPHCTQTSGDPRDYDRHLQTHTNKRPFKCKWCSRGFRRSDQLKRHGGTCKSKSAASVTSDVDKEEGHNNYLNTSTNSGCGHDKIDGRTNDTPELVRTSTIPRKTGMNSNCHISDQAVLKIAGKLESMAENWTSEEWANRRRIVLFRKTQKGSTVNATCQPVSVNERPTNSICISCIWWAERRECYVTSVDTVDLLEQLIGGPNSFSGPEKGRVRANLASFESLIVSKCKPDTVAFFNIIMGFSDPKPRDLEKDIKVFPWRILGDALKSVFRKYSISPSHTVSALDVDPDQRKFTTPEGQRMLSPPQTSTTPQQACPVTEELEQSLTDPSHLAPETEMLTDYYPSAFYAELVNENILPEGPYDDYPESQPAQSHKAPCADMSLDPGHSSPSLSSPFPTSQCHSPSPRRLEAQVSSDISPGQWVSPTWASTQQMEEIQSQQASVCVSPAQRDVLVDPTLISDIQLDSNSDEAKQREGVGEGPSAFPHQARPAPDSNPPSLQNELDLSGTLIQNESDTEIVEDEIVVCLRQEKDQHKHNAPGLSLDKQTDGVDDTYQNTKEQARGSKLSAKIDDWGHTIADGKITIYNKNTLLTNFDRGTQREVLVRDLCPEVQNILDRIYENLLQEDITQQEDEAEAKHIDIKRRIRATTQRNTSCSENTDAQQCRCHEETHSTIDKLQSILPESKGLDLIRISAHELKNILEMAQDILCKPINHIKVFLVSRQGLGAHRDPRHNRGTP
ncbi:hypothetical protein FOMA001_g20229 [Fusarium oxysporum f. sp. matthiolae]|nr:hypothetical protein FOMA001_g20229 [Fusarium oxysporum f. sp. matthiolae]